MSAHLGSWVSPLADGQLDPRAAEAAFAHVAVCPACARELEAARTARAALLQARDVTPAPDLAERLLALSTTIPPADDDPLRRPLRETGWETPEQWRPALTGDLDERRRLRSRRLVAAGAGAAGVLGLALFALGQAPVVVPDPSRSAALALLSRAGDTGAVVVDGTAADETTTGGAPGSAAAWLDEHGWVAPRSLPDGYEIGAVRLVGGRPGAVGGEPGAVELDLEGPEGTLVVREQVGRLPGVAEVSARRDVEVLSREPWHVVWQAGDVTLEVVGDVPDDVLAEVVAAFPGRGYDAGVLPRISRGWTTVTGALWRP